MPENILVERRGRVEVITLNRPRALNALSPALIEELGDALEIADRDPDVGAAVLTGGPRVFAAGADITDMAGQSAVDQLTRDQTGRWARISGFSKPLIAAVNGYALGGGCELALACDLRVVADTARLGQPEILLGIIPGAGGTQRLPRLVGVSRAKDLVLTGRQVDAEEALRIGLADRVAPAAETLDVALELAGTLAKGALIAQAYAKLAIDRGLEGTLAAGLDEEAKLFVGLFRTDDARNGIKSFLEHGPGKATFTGR